MRKSHIVVLESSGPIGGWLTTLLKYQKGVMVTAISRPGDRTADAWWSSEGPDNVDRLRLLFRTLQPDAVVNCAGEYGGRSDAVNLFKENWAAANALTEAMDSASPAARLIHIACGADLLPDACGRAKATPSETILARMPSRATILDVFNVSGPLLQDRSYTFAGRCLRILECENRETRRQLVVRLGDLSLGRDFIDIRDVASAAARAALQASLETKRIDIGSGSLAARGEFLHALASMANIDLQLSWSAERSDGIVADTRHARNVLGWKPQYTWLQTVHDCWARRGVPYSADPI